VRSNAGLVAQQSSADIPTASELGLFVLALMLGALAILRCASSFTLPSPRSRGERGT